MSKKTPSEPEALGLMTQSAPYAVAAPEAFNLVPAHAAEPAQAWLSGEVIMLDHKHGMGYVKVPGHDTRYGLSRRFIDKAVWAMLKVGTPVRFVDNGRNAADKLAIGAPEALRAQSLSPADAYAAVAASRVYSDT